MGEEELGMGFRNEAEQLMVSLLNGEVEEPNAAQSLLDSHLTLLMAAEEEGSDLEDDDMDDDEDKDDSEEPPKQACGWPVPELQPKGGKRTSVRQGTNSQQELELEGCLLSQSSPGVGLTTCGHAAHLTCWQHYMGGLHKRVAMGESFEGEGMVRPQRGEFICPVCRRLANTLMPLAPCEADEEKAESADSEVATASGAAATASTPSTSGAQAARAESNGGDSAKAVEGASTSVVNLRGAAATAAWARQALTSLLRESDPSPGGPKSEHLESFASLCVCHHGGLPPMSVLSDDVRVVRMPSSLLTHAAAIAERLRRLPSHAAHAVSETSVAAEAAAGALKLRALWNLARSAPTNASQCATAALRIAALSSASSASSAETELRMHEGEPAMVAHVSGMEYEALMCCSPLHVFVELLALSGLSGAPHALLCALSVALWQALAGMAALGKRNAGQWTAALRDMAAAVGADSAASDGNSGVDDSAGAAARACAEWFDDLCGKGVGASAAQPPSVSVPSGSGGGASAEGNSGDALLGRALGLVGRLLRAHCRDLMSTALTLLRVVGDGKLRASEQQGVCVLSDCFAALALAPSDAAATLRAMLRYVLWSSSSVCSLIWMTGAPIFAAASLTCDPLEASLSTLPAFTALPSGAPPPIGLVPLPRSFEQLFHEAAAAPCAQCGASPETRALCLACGAVVCGIESPHGPRAAVSHAHACSTGAGLFVLTSSSAVLLVRERRVMLLGSPYRDAHGEVDLGLTRGKPLSLSNAEYEALARQWLGLNFDETARAEENDFGM
uniref:E3 ubiquitin-protein ligase n=1 Tax=Chrysotila carterae TaxID=13221 RepID=A0A7S4BG65_CHRCT